MTLHDIKLPLQVELHPYNQQPQLVRYCAENSIAVTGFSPLGAGSYVELDMATVADSALTNPIVAQVNTCQISPLLFRYGSANIVSPSCRHDYVVLP